MMIAKYLAAGVSLSLLVSAAQAATFTAASFTFEQDNTPDQLELIGDGATLDGAVFSAGNATRITSTVAFPSSPAGFDPSLSLGRQGFAQAGLDQGTPGDNCSGACAINLPDGNVGTVTRHGLTLSWSGDRGLLDEAGDDFVVYESASNSTSDEGFMVRLGDPEGAFSDWRFETFDAFESYTGGNAGAMATAFDIASFNFQSSGPVSIIQIANLIDADTLSGSGVVLFDGSGASHGFGSGALDPDPLYLGAISALGSTVTTVPLPAGLPLLIAALGVFGLLRRW